MFPIEVSAGIEVNDNNAWSQDFIHQNKKKIYHQKIQLLIELYML